MVIATLRGDWKVWLSLLLLMLGGGALLACSDRAQEAEDKYKIVKAAHADATEICARGKAVTDAYLDAREWQKYQEAKVMTDSECQTAQSDERDGIFRAPDGHIIVPSSLDMSSSSAMNAVQ